MIIKLCYKEYPFKISQKACKTFFDDTELDLQTVFLSYISAWYKSKVANDSPIDRIIALSKLYPREIACKALHCMIRQEDSSIPMLEIQDATFRVSWLEPIEGDEDYQDEFAAPWCLVMLNTALKISEYFTKHLEVKKTDTSDK
jgi:hypothetical protein